MIRNKKFKYNLYRTVNNTWEEELYNIEVDSSETKNLANVGAFTHIKEELKKQMDAWIEQNADPFYSQRSTSL